MMQLRKGLFYCFLALILFFQTTDGRICNDYIVYFNAREQSRSPRVIQNDLNGCSVINGNLHLDGIAMIQNLSAKMEVTCRREKMEDIVFPTIQEITGYLLIGQSCFRSISFPKLVRIGGEMFYESKKGVNDQSVPTNLSVYIFDNQIGRLVLPRLSEIANGNVLIRTQNAMLDDAPVCLTWKTINWTEILLDPKQQEFRVAPEASECPEQCDSACYDRVVNQTNCWGPSPEQCQEYHKLPCGGLNCRSGRCFKDPVDNQYRCCHDECAIGCVNASESGCYACQHVSDDGVCRPWCPGYAYNWKQQLWSRNLSAALKYQFRKVCVSTCPVGYLIAQDDRHCVKQCPTGYQMDSTRTRCVACGAGDCKTICPGLEYNVFDSEPLNDSVLDQYVSCTFIDGSLVLGPQFWKRNTRQFIADMLQRLSGVTEVRGNVYISEYNVGPQMDFLSNLAVVHAIPKERNIPIGLVINNCSTCKVINLSKLQHVEVSFRLFNSDLLENVYLNSLRQIILRPDAVSSDGQALKITNNKKLCFVQTVNWTAVLRSKNSTLPAGVITVANNSNQCGSIGNTCRDVCDGGCWGPRDTECVNCKRLTVTDISPVRCVSSCAPEENLYALAGDAKSCGTCEQLCAGGCTAPGADNCMRCRYAADGGVCVQFCNVTKYAQPTANGAVCTPCAGACMAGCTGPNATLNDPSSEHPLASGGCNKCQKVLLDFNQSTHHRLFRCMNINDSCPPMHYQLDLPESEMVSQFRELFGRLEGHATYSACVPCHAECEDGCSNGSAQGCTRCARYTSGDDDASCLATCTSGFNRSEPANARSAVHNARVNAAFGFCFRCHPQCRPDTGCFGPLSSDCAYCAKYKIIDRNTNTHYCNDSCPADENAQPGEMEFTCAPARLLGGDSVSLVVAIAVAVAVLLVLAIALIICCIRRAAVKHPVDELGPEDNHDEPPGSGRLITIDQADLRRGQVIGSGAFGTVYQGVWVSSLGVAKGRVKIPVAMKVLHDSAPKECGKELWQEAHVMATVVHPHCVRLVGVCMPESQMMLVTQLMPLGCLLDYVRRHANELTPKPMLHWCLQIAKAMRYLESRNIVHRDLAARNVLLQSLHHVRISDFGLAKALDRNQSTFQATGGKLPIKWLAPESISNYLFTHKSDVWAFGVTVWEILTFGERPYDDLKPLDILPSLLRGHRLVQPGICTLDVWMVILKCWMYSSECRPSFEQLEDEFRRFVLNPTTFLNIKNRQMNDQLISSATLPHNAGVSHFGTLPPGGSLAAHQELLANLVRELAPDVAGEWRDVDDYFILKNGLALPDGVESQRASGSTLATCALDHNTAVRFHNTLQPAVSFNQPNATFQLPYDHRANCSNRSASLSEFASAKSGGSGLTVDLPSESDNSADRYRNAAIMSTQSRLAAKRPVHMLQQPAQLVPFTFANRHDGAASSAAAQTLPRPAPRSPRAVCAQRPVSQSEPPGPQPGPSAAPYNNLPLYRIGSNRYTDDPCSTLSPPAPIPEQPADSDFSSLDNASDVFDEPRSPPVAPLHHGYVNWSDDMKVVVKPRSATGYLEPDSSAAVSADSGICKDHVTGDSPPAGARAGGFFGADARGSMARNNPEYLLAPMRWPAGARRSVDSVGSPTDAADNFGAAPRAADFRLRTVSEDSAGSCWSETRPLTKPAHSSPASTLAHLQARWTRPAPRLLPDGSCVAGFVPADQHRAHTASDSRSDIYFSPAETHV